MNEQMRWLGIRVRQRFEQYEKDRRPLEIQWMKNFRQYRGIYDPEVTIPPGRSRVYPRDTSVKCLGLVAKIMELMFPAHDRNYSVQPSPVPDINEADIAAIIDGMQSQQTEESGQIRHEDIENAVFRFAEDRARNMERKVEDQLGETDYTGLARKALRAGVIYGFGVSKGPLVRFETERSWQFDDAMGLYRPMTRETPRPYFEPCKVWDIYPDLAATAWSTQEGLFERRLFKRNELWKLTDDDAFDGEAIREYLKTKPRGNYTRRQHESELSSLRHHDLTHDVETNQYEVIRYLGMWDGQDLKKVKVDLAGGDPERDHFVEIWMLDDQIIRVNLAPFGAKVSDNYHVFVFEDDEETGITGIGLPEKVRDTQMKLCTIDRMTIDNAATSAGPILEVNDDLLKRGQDTDTVHAFKVFHRRGEGTDAGYPAIRDIRVESHIQELAEFRREVKEQMDVESNLPAWLFGNARELGEAFRTTSNMSMMQGGATMVTKDIIRSFDRWIESLVGALVRWNMEFLDDERIQGDYQVQARGTTSLVAKELRGQALDQFIATLTPEERAILKTREVLIDRLQARDLPVDRVVDIHRAEQILEQMRQQQSMAMDAQSASAQAKQGQLEADARLKDAQAQNIHGMMPFQADEMATRAMLNEENANIGRSRAQTEATGQLLEAMQRENDTLVRGGVM
jgi:hypothetical protein